MSADERARAIFGLPPLEPSTEPEAEQQQADARARSILLGIETEEQRAARETVEAEQQAAREAARVAERARQIRERREREQAPEQAPEPPPAVGIRLDLGARDDGETRRAAESADADRRRRVTASDRPGWDAVPDLRTAFGL